MSLLRAVPVLAVLSASATAQVPVDLHTWTAESYPAVAGFDAGIWTVAADGLSVNQSINGQPTMFVSDFNVFNTQIEGQITVNPGDDDYAGFVLGYLPGDVTNPFADYLLIDWKRGEQWFDFDTPSCTPSSTAYRGLAVSRVTGIPTADEFWGHVNVDSPCSGLADGVEELARGFTLGDTGWTAGQTYSFRFEFDATSLKVYVDDVLELDITGSFANGRLGFYNFSQADVDYNAFSLDAQATSAQYGTGWPGTLGVPTVTTSANPVLGTTIQVDLTSASPTPTTAFLVVGTADAATPTAWDGTLLVDLPNIIVLTALQLPPSGASVPYTIPSELTLVGLDLYAQLGHLDAGASSGVAFSPGLHITHGF